MTDRPDDLPMDDFLSLSREYAGALEALAAIEMQAESIVALGGGEQLATYVDQFLAMSRRAGDHARSCELLEMAGWFDDLTARASRLRAALLPG
ncbi:MAG: hypothetical protein LC732_06560 [Acidobacteria bacterium]|nr:hypothetical protein [Acidobacteriota bacterium]